MLLGVVSVGKNMVLNVYGKNMFSILSNGQN